MDHGGGGGVNGLSNLVSATVWPLLPPRPALDGRLGERLGVPPLFPQSPFPPTGPDKPIQAVGSRPGVKPINDESHERMWELFILHSNDFSQCFNIMF